jgi:N4-gp56 family major capsid protein
MPVNLYGDITGTIAAKLEKEALKHQQPHLVLHVGAKKFNLPKNSTDTLRFRRAIPYVAADTPLSEGVPPAATELRYEQIDMPIRQYGAYTPTTDVLVDLHTTPVLSDINKLNAENAARTKEALLWGQLRAAQNIVYAGNASAIGQVNSQFTLSELQTAVRTLNRNHGMYYTSIVMGGVKESTRPVEASYLAFVHTDAEPIIRGLAGYTPVAEYGSMKPVHEREFGAVQNVRFISSADLTPQAGAGGPAGTGAEALITADTGVSPSADVYTCIVVGMDAYGCLNVAGKGMYTPVVRNVGTPSASDPLGQTGSVGWKCYSAESILNQDWIVAIKFAVRVNP